MKKIASFQINHDTLLEGLYTSRVDADVVTYDIRMKKPNNGEYLSTGALHTIEHIFATFARNSEFSNDIIYFGPMGCRTGCYFLVRDSFKPKQVIKLVYDAFAFIADFSGEIPGNRKEECGNYLDHDLDAAKKEALKMVEIMRAWSVEQLNYPG